MGMALTLHTIRDETIDRLLADPPLVWRILVPDMPEMYFEAAGIGRKPGLIGRLLGKKPEPLPDAPPEIEMSDGEGEELYLDKSWGGIHYLLTGTAWEGEPPLNFLVSGGQPVGDVDVGFGPAHALKSSEVKEVSAALSAIDVADLKARFDPEAMMAAEVYPEIWEDDGDEAFDYCAEYFNDLKQFLDKASRAGHGVMVHLA